MAVTNPLLPSVAAGEIGELLWDRHDLQWHTSAARTLLNFIATPWGPARVAGGMRFIAPSSPGRLIPFRFSSSQAYVLEFGELGARVFADKAVVQSGGVDVAVSTPYTLAEARSIRYVQSGDVLYLVHEAHPPQKLSRLSHTSWTLAPLTILDGPYYEQNTETAHTLTPSVSAGAGTLTAAGFAPFTINDVGRLVGIRAPAAAPADTKWGSFLIQGYVSPTVVTGSVQIALSGFGAATAEWRMGLYSKGTGYPAAVALHQGRLVFGSQPAGSLPRLDASKSGDLQNFTPGTIDDDPWSAVIVTGDINIIYDLQSVRDLIVLTAGRELGVGTGSAEPITPTNLAVTPVTAHGTLDVTSLVAFSSVIFVQRDGRTLRQLQYKFDADGYAARNLMIRAPHIARGIENEADGGLMEITFAQEPYSLIWGVRDDGMGVGMGFLPEQEVMGWFRRRPAPSAAGEARLLSITSIPYGGVDQVWVVVARVIDGGVFYSIEIIEEPLARDRPLCEAFYVDSGLSLDNTAYNITGTDAATLTPDAVEGDDVLVTAGAAIFAPGDVGRVIVAEYIDAANYPPDGRDENGLIVWGEGYAEIATYVSPTQVRVNIRSPFPYVGPLAADDWGLTMTSLAGLDHLKGETVKIVGDGAIQGDRVVSAGGTLTLESPAKCVQVGLFSPAKFEPVIPETGAPQGTRIGRQQRIVKLRVKFAYSMGGRVYQRNAQGTARPAKKELIRYRTASDATNRAVPLFTGIKEIPVAGNYTRDPGIIIEQDIPMPMTITSIEPVLEAGDVA